MKGRKYDESLESCLNYCGGDPSFCGLATPGQMYNFVRHNAPEEMMGRYFRVNGIKVSHRESQLISVTNSLSYQNEV